MPNDDEDIKTKIEVLKTTMDVFIDTMMRTGVGLTEALKIVQFVKDVVDGHKPGDAVGESFSKAISGLSEIRNQSRPMFFIMVCRILTIELDEYLKQISKESKDSWK